MPEREFTQGMACWLTGNVHDDETLAKALDKSGSLVCTVIERDGYDEEWGEKWKVSTRAGTTTVSQQDISPMPDLYPEETARGFGRLDFTDLYGSECSIQESSLATERAIWLGMNSDGSFELKPPYNKDRSDPDVDTGGRMHLSQGQAAAILPILEHFVKTGSLPDRKVMP